MKKMLLLCTGLFLAAGIASATVTSENIVGYVVEKGDSSGWRQIAPPFVAVLNDEQEFILEQITGLNEWDTLQFQFADGTMGDGVTWRLGNGGTRPVDGWYRGTSTYMGKTKIKAGTGVLLQTSATTDIVVSGQVEIYDIPINIKEVGWAALGNSSPVPLVLDEIDFWGINEWDTLQFQFTDGTMGDGVTWRLGNGGTRPFDGWYRGTSTYMGNQILLPPGAGFIIQSTSSDYTVTVPAPLD